MLDLLSFPVSDSICTSLFCLSKFIIGHLVNPTILSPVMRGWGPSAVAKMTCCQQRPASHGALADHGGPAGQAGPADHGGPAGTGGLMPITEADFAPSLLYVNEVLFHPVLDYIVFLGDSYTKMQ